MLRPDKVELDIAVTGNQVSSDAGTAGAGERKRFEIEDLRCARRPWVEMEKHRSENGVAS